VAAAHGRERGGILTLLALIEEHESAFAYDWRTLFGQPLEVIEQGEMSWREAWLLAKQLLTDPSSRVFAALAGWPHPWTRETFVLADLFDLLAAAHTDRRHRSQLASYRRPSGSPTSVRIGKPDRPQREIWAVLMSRGHQRPNDAKAPRSQR
jgi:hypothetical protein